MKYCYNCKLDKPLDDFSDNWRQHDGKSTRCRACQREYDKTRKKYLKHNLYRWRREDPTARHKRVIREYHKPRKAKYIQEVKEIESKFEAFYEITQKHDELIKRYDKLLDKIILVEEYEKYREEVKKL